MKNSIQHPEPAYEFNDIKRTRKFDSSIIYALLFFLVLGLMAFKSNAETPTNPSTVKTERLVKSQQCSQLTAKKERCKRMTKNVSGVCTQHEKTQAKKVSNQSLTL